MKKTKTELKAKMKAKLLKTKRQRDEARALVHEERTAYLAEHARFCKSLQKGKDVRDLLRESIERLRTERDEARALVHKERQEHRGEREESRTRISRIVQRLLTAKGILKRERDAARAEAKRLFEINQAYVQAVESGQVVEAAVGVAALEAHRAKEPA